LLQSAYYSVFRIMVKFINKLTGTEMWVADNRKDEYIKAGHVPAFDVTEAKKPTPKKRAAKSKK